MMTTRFIFFSIFFRDDDVCVTDDDVSEAVMVSRSEGGERWSVQVPKKPSARVTRSRDEGALSG